MRTKTLLIAAAALAVGLVSSQAQTVYSANVVGYANVSTTGGQYALLTTGLDDGTNTLLSVFPSIATGSQVLIWNGTGYTSSTKTPVGWTVNLSIPPGVGFFLRTAGTAVTTNTFVGSVAVPVGGAATNNFASGVYSLVGSPVPYSDTLTGTNLNLTVPTGSQVLVWNGTGYTSSTKTPVGWTVNLPIGVGQGFFVRASSATNWIQAFPGN